MKNTKLILTALIIFSAVFVNAQCTIVADAGPNTIQMPCCAPPTIGGSPTGSSTGCSCTLFSYSWSPSTGLSSTTVANPTAAPGATTTYTVTVTHQTCGYATDAVTVTYRQDLSCCRIGDILEAPTKPNSEITIFPNPSGGEFNLKLPASSELKSVRVYNSVGELIQEQTAKEGVVSIDIRNQSNGLYFIQVVCGDKVLLFDKVLKE
ncbi:MAG: T9SS type A sorting domain-containing protein [Bacteroidia bacterium]|nr:T9SS type A sorting domain-containing protein [Bacteroidia bacterium]